jgi:uncharacterized LabA/DUF88 family protein
MALDVQNLWYSCRHIFGNEYRVDYNALLQFIQEKVIFEQKAHLEATAYLIVSSHHDQTNFITALRGLGFNIKKRHLTFNRDRNTPQNTSWDVGITADAFMQDSEYDSFILVSGDGDFTYLTEPLRELGKEVVVCSFEENISKSLAASASRVHHFNKDVVYNPKQRWEEAQSTK